MRGSAVGGRDDEIDALLEMASDSVALGGVRAAERLQLGQHRSHHDGV
jgi:hypothetical protein